MEGVECPTSFEQPFGEKAVVGPVEGGRGKDWGQSERSVMDEPPEYEEGRRREALVRPGEVDLDSDSEDGGEVFREHGLRTSDQCCTVVTQEGRRVSKTTVLGIPVVKKTVKVEDVSRWSCYG